MQIVVIGTGQVGSRHLQSLAPSATLHTLHAVEPRADSQEVARARLGSAVGQVNFHISTDSLPKEIDIAIIATGAGVRRHVLTALLSHSRVRFLILEKILFQSVADCLWAQNFLHKHEVRTWVNFPRRVQPVYEDIHDSLMLGQPLDIHVSGSRWGLATSAVHFLDLVLLLSRSTSLTIDEFELETYPSRHSDCLDGVGLIAGIADKRHAYSIRAWAAGDAPLQVTIRCPGQCWVVTEADDRALTQHAGSENNWQSETNNQCFYYQSQITGPIVDSLLSSNSCRLATYADALQSHLPFLRAWNRNLAPGADPDTTRCLIT